MGGILGAALGESPAQAQARIEEAKKSAKDLTGLIRRKAKVVEIDTPESSRNGTPGPQEKATNGKRKAGDFDDEINESKKAKVEDAVDG
jgi:HAT1-interacting factor 1